MPTAYKSVQETKRTATPPQALTPSEFGGRVRIATFDYTLAAIMYPGDTLKLCPLPPSARILGGSIQVTDMSTNITEDADVDWAVASGNMIVGDYTLAHTGDLPDKTPRLMTLCRTVVGNADTPGTVTITGKDGDGIDITDTITVGAHGVTVDGTKYFASISKVTGAGWIIDGANDTIVVGYKALAGVEAVMDIGKEDDTDRYADALAVGTAGSYAFGSTIAQNFGDVISNVGSSIQQHLVAKVPISLSEPWAAAAVIKGWLLYSVD